MLDHKNKTHTLFKLLTQYNLTLASCESLTGGLFATTLTQIPGIGQVFKGGLVVYSNEAKIELAKVSPTILEKYGAISKECAEAMSHTQQLLKTDLAISFTGNAGPSALENKPVGLVYIGLVFKKNLISKSYRFSGSREEIRKQAIEVGIELLVFWLLDNIAVKS